MSPGSAFHNLAAITGKARSPSVECRVAGTTKAAVDAERSFCLERRSDTLKKSHTYEYGLPVNFTRTGSFCAGRVFIQLVESELPVNSINIITFAKKVMFLP